MELNVTRFVCEAEPFQFSRSVAEYGQNAGPTSWDNAVAEAGERPLLDTPEAIETARDWFGEFGAWDDDERAAWSADEVNALLIQLISGDLREAESLCEGEGPGGIDWEQYRALQEGGTCSSHLYLGDDGEVYCYLGS